MLDPAALLAAGEAVGRNFDALLEQAIVLDTGEARISACLCLTIEEAYVATLAVLRSRAPSHAPVLIRSMHEAVADLMALVANPGHLDQIRFDNADQMLKTVREFAADPDLQDEAEAQAAMAEWRAREQPIYEDLRGRGYRGITVLETFKRAGIARDYAGYRFMCSFAHNNLTTLLARHAGTDHLRVNDDLPVATLKSMLGLAISIFGRAVHTLPNYTTLSAESVKIAIDQADAEWGQVVRE